MFGLKSYGECWSGPKVGCSFNKFGKTRSCINQKKWQCSDDSSMLCSSTSATTIYAYVLADSRHGTKCPTKPRRTTPSPRITTIVPTTVPTTVPNGPPTVKCGNVQYKLTKLGCWNEFGDTAGHRAFPELLLTSRDKTARTYVGYSFDTHNYEKFLQRLVECNLNAL